MSWIVIDRVENGVAACEMEDRSMRMLPLSLLPAGAVEGDCLILIGGKYCVDHGETMRRREYNRNLLSRLMAAEEDSMETAGEVESKSEDAADTTVNDVFDYDDEEDEDTEEIEGFSAEEWESNDTDQQ